MDMLQGATATSAMLASYTSTQNTATPKKSSETVATFGKLETAVTVVKKSNDVFKQQGKAILDLIDSAVAISNAAGANAGGNNSATNKGTALNILA